MDCIFCKIIAGEIPSKKAYEDEHTLAFHDINPLAPTHILVIPKQHIPSLMAFSEGDKDVISHIHATIQKVAKEAGVDQSGFRVISNIGDEGQQTVHHVHYHVIGGRQLKWTM